MKFTDLDLKPDVLMGLKEMGYEELTPIQEETIPHILEGKDVLGLAETGSGKTGACGVPLVQLVDASLREIQVLVLVPTRELAQQYVSEVANIAKFSEVAPFAMFGGFDMDIQRAKLKSGVHILVATPGRLIDYLWNNEMPLNHIRTIVLDEADEMLKMGFIENVDFVMSCLMHEHQTLLFSATMPKEITRLTQSYLKDPVRVELIRDRAAPQSLTHNFRHIAHSNRLDALIEYLKKEEIAQGIVFCNSRAGGSTLSRELKKRFPSIDYIHGGLEQNQRTSIFNKFTRKEIHLMVATDVAGRGLDFSHVTHVINYDFPMSDEGYTHRTGRTGRMGREGVAMTLVTDRDLGNLKRLMGSKGVEPIWQGKAPDLNRVSTRKQGGGNRRRGGYKKRR